MKRPTQKQKQLLHFSAPKWMFNPNTGLIDVAGNVNLQDKNLDDFIGIEFGVIHGYFDCSGNNLTSLIGAPREVERDFNCSNNKLTSLVGGPIRVNGDFVCHWNKLINLEGLPKYFNSPSIFDFFIEIDPFTNLKGLDPELYENIKFRYGNTDKIRLSQFIDRITPKGILPKEYLRVLIKELYNK